jgi:hypothetical protein
VRAEEIQRLAKSYKSQLAKLANLAERLDRQLVTRDDGILESMYTYESQQVRDDLNDAVQETWVLLGEVEADNETTQPLPEELRGKSWPGDVEGEG